MIFRDIRFTSQRNKMTGGGRIILFYPRVKGDESPRGRASGGVGAVSTPFSGAQEDTGSIKKKESKLLGNACRQVSGPFRTVVSTVTM